MTASTLLADLRARGIKLSVSGERLNVDAPRGAVTPDLRTALVEHKADLIRLLGADDEEVAWRVEAMCPQVPRTGTIPILLARPQAKTTPPGTCVSCGGPLAEDRRIRCGPCVQAVERVLNDVREGH
jgi:tubulysin polyketide synthase-like protein